MVIVGRHAGTKEGDRVRPVPGHIRNITVGELNLSRFAIRTPYLNVVCCLIVLVACIVNVVQMPLDLFPASL
jgi:hypothetical protein